LTTTRLKSMRDWWRETVSTFSGEDPPASPAFGFGAILALGWPAADFEAVGKHHKTHQETQGTPALCGPAPRLSEKVDSELAPTSRSTDY
jgi:hypothetical protein